MDILCCVKMGKKNDPQDATGTEGPLYKIFKNLYAPFLLSKPIRIGVVVAFFGWLCLSISVAPKIEIGLDQQLAMPEDSYMLKYFEVNILC